MYPTRLLFLHSGLAIGLIIVDPFVVPKRCTSDHVNNHKDDQYDDVDHRDLPPTLLHASQNPGLAGVTVVAQLLLVVAPPIAIEVGSHEPCPAGPGSLVHIIVSAFCRGLAASRLHTAK